MTAMRQLRFASHGLAADVLELTETARPEPGPGEVRVRLVSRPINPSDLLTIRGQYGHLPPLPAVPGLEGAGYIEAMGPSVTGWRAGDRVVPLTLAGTWQEAVLVKVEDLIRVPSDVSNDDAAQLLANPFTAWLLLEELKAQPGEIVVQTAAGSAVGRAVIQLARLRGLRLINLVRSAQTAASLKAIGAENIVLTSDADWHARLLAAAGGIPPRLALDAVAGPQAAKLASLLAPEALMLCYGVLSLQPMILDPRRLIFHDLKVRGFWLMRWLRQAGAAEAIRLGEQLLQLMRAGTLAMPVAAHHDLADCTAAIAAAEQPGRSGKIILTG